MTNSKQRLPHFTKEKLDELARLNYKHVKEFSEQYKEEDIEYYNSAILPVLEKYKHLDILDIAKVEEVETVKEVSESVIIFCPKCGSKNYMDSKYCFKCGNDINIPKSAFKTKATRYEKKDEHDIISYESWMRGENRNAANGIIQNDKLGGCLVSWLVFGIISTSLGLVVTLFIPYNIYGSGIIIILIILGMFNLISYILLLNKYKAGLYLYTILLIIGTLILFTIPSMQKDLPISLLSTFIFSTIFYSLIFNNWKKFK